MYKFNFFTPEDERFYGHWGSARISGHGRSCVDYYNKKITERREKYPFELDKEAMKIADQLKQNGYNKIPAFFKDQKLLKDIKNLKEQTEEYIRENKCIKRRDEHMVFIDQPLLNNDLAAKIAFNDGFIKIATAFFGCLPAIGTVSLRKSFLNDLPEETNQLWHRDFNSTVRFMKFFVYLNDVKEPEDGPFAYVYQSNRKMFDRWWMKHRWTDEEMAMIYGKENIVHCTANFGDLLIAQTNGFHKGQKPTKNTRVVYVINYLIHPELAGGTEQAEEARFKMKQSTYDALPDWKKPVADFLVKV